MVKRSWEYNYLYYWQTYIPYTYFILKWITQKNKSLRTQILLATEIKSLLVAFKNFKKKLFYFLVASNSRVISDYTLVTFTFHETDCLF